MAWSALKLSLLVASLATLIVALLGTAAGWLLARYRFRGRALLDALLMLPLVLPPTVSGYYLIVLLGRRGWIGGPLERWTGWSLPFSFAACVLAASVIALPLMVRAARAAFEALSDEQLTAAAALGRRPITVFVRVALPLARRGLIGGLMLAFARALGEFGATLLLAGNIPGRTQTLPLALYEAALMGNDRMALLLALLLTAISLAALLLLSRVAEAAR